MLVLPTSGAWAATAGSTSAESATVSVTVPQEVKLTGLNGATDFQFGSWSPETAGDETAALNLCAWSNSGAPAAYSYKITATSTNGGSGAFTMNDGATTPDTLSYHVYWAGTKDVTAPASATELTESSPATFAMPSSNNPTCTTNGDNASLIVQIVSGDLSAAVAGDYSDTLTITMGVSP